MASSNPYGQGPSSAPSFGGEGGQGFAPQGGAPKKSKTLPIILCAGCAVLVLLLVLVGGGIFLLTRDGGGSTGGGATTTHAGSDEGGADEGGSSGEGDGSEDSPYALGEQFTLGEGSEETLDVSIGEVDWDATEAVMGESDSNTEPGDGETYILVPVTATYHGSDEAMPGFVLSVDYVTSSGDSYTDENSIVPDDWVSLPPMQDGDSAEWNIGMIVPEDQIQDGSFAVTPLMDFTADPIWVSAT